MKAAFLRSGITMTHFVPSRTLSGTPLSGALNMSFTTFAEAVIRSLSFSPESAQAKAIRPSTITLILEMFFISLTLNPFETSITFSASLRIEFSLRPANRLVLRACWLAFCLFGLGCRGGRRRGGTYGEGFGHGGGRAELVDY